MNRMLHLVLAAGLFVPPALAAPLYRITDLGTLAGGDTSVAYGINNSGQIVGQSSADTDGTLSNDFAVLFNAADPSQIQIINRKQAFGAAYGISEAGTIVGEEHGASLPGFLQMATIFNAPNPEQNVALGTLGGNLSVARGISDNGIIVGQSKDADNDFFATLFDASGNGGNVNLGLVEGGSSNAFAVNDAGTIVGLASTSQGQHAALFDASGNGANVDLGTLDTDPSVAFAVGNNGVIAGRARATGTGDRATVFDPTGGGANVDIGQLSACAGFGFGEVRAINNAGMAVGSSCLIAVMFDLSGNTGPVTLKSLVDPNDPLFNSFVLREAFDINDNGWIVGQGEIGGEMHAFLLSLPIPEPGSLALFGLALAGFAATGRRRV